MLQNSFYAILGTFCTLLNNTDLYLSYFILSYVFLGHNDSVEWALLYNNNFPYCRGNITSSMEAILWDRFQLKILEPKIERRVYEFWIQNSKNIKVEKNIGNNNFQLLQKKYHIKYGSKCVRLILAWNFITKKFCGRPMSFGAKIQRI